MAYYISQILFYGIPIAAVVFFVVSLWLYIAAKRQGKQNPESVSEYTMKIRKTLLIISSTILGTLVVVVAAMILLLYTAVAFM